ncbi:MAG: transposase, partial [Burkholderiales bacterium]|nr:transposase [Anaerolineae bacterium]
NTFIAFLEHLLLDQYPTSSLVLVMDNAPFHRSKATQAALSLFQHRLVVFWLPPYCPTLNPIERFWKHLKDIALANHLFPSVPALLDSLNRVLTAQNEPSHPLHLSFANYFP